MQKNSSSDLDLIQEIRKDPTASETSYSELYERTKNVYPKVIQFLTQNISGYQKDDLANDSHFVFYKAVETFDPSKETKFSTWFLIMSKYHCLEAIKKSHKQWRVQSAVNESLELSPRSLSDSVESPNEKHYYFKVAEKYLDDASYSIMEKKSQGYKIKEIAKELGIHKTYCSYLFCNAKKTLKEAFEREGIKAY